MQGGPQRRERRALAGHLHQLAAAAYQHETIVLATKPVGQRQRAVELAAVYAGPSGCVELEHEPRSGREALVFGWASRRQHAAFGATVDLAHWDAPVALDVACK